MSWAMICCVFYSALILVWDFLHRNHAPLPADQLEIEAAGRDHAPHPNDHLAIEAAGERRDAYEEGNDEQLVHDWSPGLEERWNEWLNLHLPQGDGSPEE